MMAVGTNKTANPSFPVISGHPFNYAPLVKVKFSSTPQESDFMPIPPREIWNMLQGTMIS